MVRAVPGPAVGDGAGFGFEHTSGGCHAGRTSDCLRPEAWRRRCRAQYVVAAEECPACPAALLRPDVLRYVRASPTGPGTPLVLAPTVFGSRLELTLTHRDTTRGIGPASLLLERVAEHLAALVRTAADATVAPTLQEV